MGMKIASFGGGSGCVQEEEEEGEELSSFGREEVECRALRRVQIWEASVVLPGFVFGQ